MWPRREGESRHRLEREVGASQAGGGCGGVGSAQQGTQGKWACLRISLPERGSPAGEEKGFQWDGLGWVCMSV